MCGIIGYTGPRKALPILMQGLRLLEYRGYDSSGVALSGEGGLRTFKKAGKLDRLEENLPATSSAKSGIGHTRWATHGIVSDENAHPHLGPAGKVAIVHNGIIDNWVELKRDLEAEGSVFKSGTDSEVIAHLIERNLKDQAAPEAVAAALRRLEGTFGLACVFADKPGLIVAARNGSPLAVGVGDGETFVASDPSAFCAHTRQAVFLHDGELVVLEPKRWETRTLRGEPVAKLPETIPDSAAQAEKGVHPDFFLKEVYEQPLAVSRTLGNGGRLVRDFGAAKLGGLDLEPRELQGISEVVFIAMGSALHAAMVGRSMVENWARIPARAEDASEFRSGVPLVKPDALYVAVSQSGETADTIGAIKEIQVKGGRTVGIVNAVGSTLARLCGHGAYVHAGPELSVAASKSYTSQIVCCALLALSLGRARHLSLAEGRSIVDELTALPEKLELALGLRPRIEELARGLKDARSVLFLGRGFMLPAALEGALKLKELSYIHAEGFSGGALKHGPLALVGPDVTTFALLAEGESLAKTLSNMSEVRARGGRVIALTNGEEARVREAADEVIGVPSSMEALAPVLEAVPLQLLARSAASLLGRDVDRPRNLAKSVTTE
ncbi:MAG TPA: glutamine--fructose-6-phosphate transaminase (isomerizing) [Rectinemataceae bacterium]|nr:glutamine--fructose-6-phosphate transaminase (isomerizing) [Rectinemataceae bacterium]